mgnify:CR=1 FL=1|jgi:hypothetical protein
MPVLLSMNDIKVRKRAIGLILICLFSGPAAALAEIDHRLWDDLLQSHVRLLDGGRKTTLDYAAMAADRQQLQTYLGTLAGVSRTDFDNWSRNAQLAFLINAYNAWTVELILQHYPDIDSIRDIGFLPGAAWRRDFVELFGGQVSLDEIEHEMIRQWPQFQEPRIHFAVNCAATGCPALRAEAWRAEDLQAQLEDSTKRFLMDRDRNWWEGNTLTVSRIFDWYGEDFEQGWQGIESLRGFFIQYSGALELTDSQIEKLRRGEVRIRFSRYDWGLNDISGRR